MSYHCIRLTLCLFLIFGFFILQRSTKDFDVMSETKCNNTVVKRQTDAGEKTVVLAVKNDGPAYDSSMPFDLYSFTIIFADITYAAIRLSDWLSSNGDAAVSRAQLIPAPARKSSHLRWWIYVAIGCGVLLLLVALVIIIVFVVLRRKKSQYRSSNEQLYTSFLDTDFSNPTMDKASVSPYNYHL